MAKEPGGYSDKLGNRYEGRWIVKQLLRLLNEELTYVEIEAVGDDEVGVDLWIEDKKGKRFAHQCKMGYKSVSAWSIANLGAKSKSTSKSILENMGFQLDRSTENHFCLVSPLSSPLLSDICGSARFSSGDAESFYQHQIVGIGKEKEACFKQFCERLSLNDQNPLDRQQAYLYLQRFYVEQWPDTLNSLSELKTQAEMLVNGNADTTISVLADYVLDHLRKKITPQDIWQVLTAQGLHPRKLSSDPRITPQIEELKTLFDESISPNLINNELIPRKETIEILEALENSAIVIIHGRPGQGKSGVLYELVQHFKQNHHTYLPLRLDRQEPKNSTRQYGQTLDLPESPVRCLEAVSHDSVATLIIDQLDAIRWTSGHSQNALDVCKSLVKEILYLRNNDVKINIIIACRTYDLENDKEISQWLNNQEQDNENRLSEFKIGYLSQETVMEIAKKLGVNELSKRQIEILRSPQHMSIWASLIKNGCAIELNNRVQLMQAYWDEKGRELKQKGISSDALHMQLSNIISYMEKKGKLFAPYSTATNQDAIEALSACGLIQVQNNKISFSHQSYLDFQIAKNLTHDIHQDKKSITEWLGNKNQQSLFRREQLRQVFSLLSEESPDDFLIEVQSILSNDGIRFHLKHLTLEAIAQIENPETPLLNYLLALTQQEEWKEHIVTTIFCRHAPYIRWLFDSGVLNEWLNDAKYKTQALLIVRSISKELPHIVVESLNHFKNDEGWHLDIINCLNWNEEDDSDEMFELRLHLLKHGTSPNYIHWEKLPTQRAIKLLEAILISHTPKDFSYDSTYQLRQNLTKFEDWNHKDFENLLKATTSYPENTWNMLTPHILRLSKEEDERYRLKDLWLDPDNQHYRQGKELLPHGIVKLCIEAGKIYAQQNSQGFLTHTALLQKLNSPVIQFILANAYETVHTNHSDNIIQWILDEAHDFSVGTSHIEPKWIPIARLVKRFSPHCSVLLFNQFEKAISYYKGSNLLNTAEYWIKSSRKGHYGIFWGIAQYFILPALDINRRKKETDELIVVLNRKAESFPRFFSIDDNLSRSGWVSSSIPRDRLKRISNNAWLKIVNNTKLSPDAEFTFKHYEVGYVKESSIRYFSEDLSYAASLEPERFTQLALMFPENTHTLYKEAILNALKKQAPHNLSDEDKAIWKPANHELVLSVLDKLHVNNSDYSYALCELISSRASEHWPKQTLNQLTDYALSDPDPETGKLTITTNGGDDNTDSATAHDLSATALNCSRGRATNCIGQLLWEQSNLLDYFKTTLVKIGSDPHPSVRVAALSAYLPIINIDKEFAFRLFITAIKDDFRVASTHDGIQFFNHYIETHHKILEPLVLQMITSPYDDVRESASQEVVACWLFHNREISDIDSLICEDKHQRKGVANIATRFIKETIYFEKCKNLIEKLQIHECEETQQELGRLIRQKALYSDPRGISVLIRLSHSPAFSSRNASSLLYDLENYNGDLLPFAELLFSVGNYYINLHQQADEASVNNRHESHYYTPLLLRLYEQAQESKDEVTQNRCLDIWDAMFEQQIVSVSSISKTID